jgi:hypothetical protein
MMKFISPEMQQVAVPEDVTVNKDEESIKTNIKTESTGQQEKVNRLLQKKQEDNFWSFLFFYRRFFS